MELHMHSHHYVHRTPDWRAAVSAGVIAGVVFLLLESLLTLAIGASPWTMLKMTAAITMGPGVLQSAPYQFGVLLAALMVHFFIAIVFVLALSLVIAPFQLDSSWAMATFAGALFGLVAYLFNFYIMTAFFPWFAEMRNMVTVVTHILAGIAAADMYMRLERKRTPADDVGGSSTRVS
jgi:hypothetical protein